MWHSHLVPLGVGLVCNANGAGGESDVGIHLLDGWTPIGDFERWGWFGTKKESIEGLPPLSIWGDGHGGEINVLFVKVVYDFITRE